MPSGYGRKERLPEGRQHLPCLITIAIEMMKRVAILGANSLHRPGFGLEIK
jgi:hypothetical protein